MKNENDARLILIQHAQIEMAELYKKLKGGTIGAREANALANVMSKLLVGVRLEIDHHNLIMKMPLSLPDYEKSVKELTADKVNGK